MLLLLSAASFFLVLTTKRNVQWSAIRREGGVKGANGGGSPGDYKDGCTVLLSTFPNSGTTWTQAIFRAATGLVSESIYVEGPPSQWPGAYVHGPGPTSDERFPNQALGECRFIKSHERMADEKMPSLYQRAVILYRDPEDNLEANLRYLEKSSNPKVAEACGDLDFGQWEAADSDGYHTFEEMHYVAHRRFYCHAQRYPVPRLFVTYSALLSDPLAGFREILTFIGYPEADLDSALEKNPLTSHSFRGSPNYVAISDEQCEALDEEFHRIRLSGNECVRAASDVLQFRA